VSSLRPYQRGGGSDGLPGLPGLRARRPRRGLRVRSAAARADAGERPRSGHLALERDAAGRRSSRRIARRGRHAVAAAAARRPRCRRRGPVCQERGGQPDGLAQGPARGRRGVGGTAARRRCDHRGVDRQPWSGTGGVQRARGPALRDLRHAEHRRPDAGRDRGHGSRARHGPRRGRALRADDRGRAARWLARVHERHQPARGQPAARRRRRPSRSPCASPPTRPSARSTPSTASR
jgi:hypothetical protein